MNSSDARLSEYTNKLLDENEIRANRITSIAVLLIGLIFIGGAVLDLAGLYDLVRPWFTATLLADGVANAVMYFIARSRKFEGRNMKKILLTFVMISAEINCFFSPIKATFIVFGPIVMSAMYYDKTLVRRMGWMNWVLYTVALFANTILEYTSEEMRYVHQIQGITVFRFPQDVILYNFIPQSMFFVVTCMVCTAIMTAGNDMMKKQAGMISTVTSLSTELAIAADIQQSALPDSKYCDPDGRYTINAIMRPAREVGGDFYDYYEIGSDAVFLIADVSDKGLSAAMFMMKAQNAVKESLITEPDLGRAIAMINEKLCDDNKDNLFVTMWLAKIDAKSGIGQFANCGHMPAIVKDAEGKVKVLENDPDIMLGVFEDAKIRIHDFSLKPGDNIFIYTDGLTDAVNSETEAFGEARLLDKVESISMESNDFCDRLFEEIDKFAGETEQFDDMTAMNICITK